MTTLRKLTPAPGRTTDLMRLYRRNERGTLQYARALYAQAYTWTSFCIEHTHAASEEVYAKAFDALAFCLTHQPSAFAVPSKLAGVSGRQEALEALAGDERPRGYQLEPRLEANGRVAVYYKTHHLGYLQDKYAWFRLLIEHGASIYLLRVTGLDDPDKTLGVNIAFGFVAQAIGRFNRQPVHRAAA